MSLTPTRSFMNWLFPFWILFFVFVWIVVGEELHEEEHQQWAFLAAQEEIKQWHSTIDVILEEGLTEMNRRVLQRQVLHLGSRPNIVNVLVGDQNNQVIASSHERWLGKSLFDIQEVFSVDQREQFLQQQPLLQNQLQNWQIWDSSRKEWLFARPLMFRSASNAMGFAAIGTIVIVMNLEDYPLLRQQQDCREWKLQKGLLLLLAALMMLVFYWMYIRRIEQLYYNCETIQQGEYHQIRQLAGRDDLAEISYLGDDLANSLAQKQEQIQKLEAELQMVSQDFEQVLYVTSHDLRTPLVNIQGFSKELHSSVEELMALIQASGLPQTYQKQVEVIYNEDIAEAFEYINKSAQKMENLLAGILKISRLGRMEMKMTQIFMQELLETVQKNLQYQLTQNKAILVIDENLPNCVADENLLHQVFTNLISNAIQYMDGVRLPKIQIGGTQESTGVVYFVKDNGIGIPSDQYKNIFSLFHRLNRFQGNGEGLGLAIVKKIVEQHHGKVWVESEVGIGSTFFIQLPFVRERDH